MAARVSKASPPFDVCHVGPHEVAAPPYVSLGELKAASLAIERDEDNTQDEADAWLKERGSKETCRRFSVRSRVYQRDRRHARPLRINFQHWKTSTPVQIRGASVRRLGGSPRACFASWVAHRPLALLFAS
jgi:hypothetical protein